MSLLSRLLGRERRNSPAIPTGDVRASDPFLAEYFGLGRFGSSGARFASADEAVSSLAVAARCVSLISEGLAALPLRVYRWTDDGGREPAPTHPLDVLLNDVSNPQASAFAVREGLVADVLMHGNGYLRQEIDGRGRVSALFYLPRPWVGVERLLNGRLRYRISEPLRGTYVLTEDEVIHLRYRTRDGIMGVSPMEWAGIAVGLSVAQSELAQSQVDRGFTPDISFETETSFDTGEKSDNAFRRLKSQISERMGKMRREAAPLLLESGLTAKVLSATGREAQFHEMRLRGMADIATLYGVPVSVLGLGTHASYGSLAEESRALVRDCYRPWARRIEAELIRTALTAEGRRNFTIAHDLSDLMAGDPGQMAQAYALGRQWEWLSGNDVRSALGMPRAPGLDAYRNPATTGTGDRTGAPQPPAPRGSTAAAQPAEV